MHLGHSRMPQAGRVALVLVAMNLVVVTTGGGNFALISRFRQLNVGGVTPNC